MRRRILCIISLAALLSILVSCNGKPERIISRTTVSDQLSSRQVTCFAEDSTGYIWVGTQRGLNRYNSDEFHQYFADDSGLPSNFISSLFVDAEGRLWVGTRNGAGLYHPESDSFESIRHTPPFDQVHQIWQDHSGRVFFNMIEQLCVYREGADSMQVLLQHFDPSGEYGNESFCSRDGHVWSITAHLVREYDPETLEVLFEKEVSRKTEGAWMTSDDRLWIAFDKGLSLFDTHSKEFLAVPSSIVSHPVLFGMPIKQVYELDGIGVLLFTDKGSYLYDGETVIGQDNPSFPIDFPYRDVSVLFTDSNENLWYGTQSHGFITTNKADTDGWGSYLSSYFKDIPVEGVSGGEPLWILASDKRVYHFREGSMVEIDAKAYIDNLQPNLGAPLLYADSHGTLWIAAGKLYETRLRGTRLETIHAFTPESSAQTSVITEDKAGNIWVGYGFADYLKVRYAGSSAFERFPVDSLSSMSLVYSLLPLSSGNLMMGMALSNPLLLDVRTHKTRPVPIWEDADRKDLVTSICEDRSGKVWIGTMGSGLFRYDVQNGDLQRMEEIGCKEICGIVEDDDGGIWVSTLSGLYRYNWPYGDFLPYWKANQEYSLRSSALWQKHLVFGGSGGLTAFLPGNLDEETVGPLCFERLYVDNEPVQWNPSETILIGYKESSFALSYASLDYSPNAGIQYRYRLEGYHDKWIDNRDNRNIQFTKLPARKYTLTLQSIGGDRNEVLSEASVKIRVQPAPWNTWWAYTLYALMAALMLGTFYHSRVNSIKQREAAKRAELEKEQEKRINQVNMSFFANISHEFRTPLTMISGPVTQMEKGQATPQMLSAVKWNVARMLRLVNQLMDFNKLENDTLKLQVAKDDVVALIKQTAAAYAFSIGEKGIAFNGFGLEDSFTAWVDADKLDKILSNLLSNAMKFTPQGGEIAFSFDVVPTESGRWMKMVVADNGPKIPPESLERIFDRYYQVENHHNYGTGIGLYFARKLAELHHGSLKCENLAGEGLAFTLLLPADDVYADSEKVDHNPEKLPIFLETAEFKTSESEGQHSQSVLIVDDDPDIVAYECSLLAPQYNVRKAFNAQSALEMLRAEMPDVIISDVSMPGTDGYALCRAIKEDADVCHIPVILVTAKTTVENQIEGLHQGADAYVTKPFDPAYLLAVIKSQLDNRERLRGILGKATTVEDIKEEEAALSPQDSALMKELYELMEKELDNDMLNINSITDQLHISRSKFYYKIRALTGENPNSFFKNYKLNRAKELLMDGRYNISEVADMTGFSNPSVFGRNFKARFGVTPTEWCNNQKTS